MGHPIRNGSKTARKTQDGGRDNGGNNQRSKDRTNQRRREEKKNPIKGTQNFEKKKKKPSQEQTLEGTTNYKYTISYLVLKTRNEVVSIDA